MYHITADLRTNLQTTMYTQISQFVLLNTSSETVRMKMKLFYPVIYAYVYYICKINTFSLLIEIERKNCLELQIQQLVICKK